MKKWWVKLLVFLAAVVVLISVVIGMSSAHSKNTVERYKDQLRAAGEKLDFKDFAFPDSDPNQNGRDLLEQAFNSMGPLSTGLVSSNPPAAMRMVAPGKAMVGWQESEIVSDFDKPATNSWVELQQQLQFENAAMEFLRQASQRSRFDFVLDYDQGPLLLLPHLSKMKRAALLLSAATLADLHGGDTDSAATNVHTLLRIADAWQGESLLISQMVRMAMIQIAVNAQWEFLQATNLTEEQLALLQRDWNNLQIVAPTERAFEMERAFAVREIEQMRTSHSRSTTFAGLLSPGSSGGSGSGDWLDWLKDTGQSIKQKTADNLWRVSWSYDDEMEMLQGDQVLVEAMREIHTNGFFKNAIADGDRKITALGLDHPRTNWLRNQFDDEIESIMGSGSVLSLRKSMDRTLSAEVARVTAGAALALKRYQLRHGVFPPDLNALVPEFLSEVPRDPIDGHPLRYQFLPDGAFLLYSIGSDGVDNGGDASTPAASKSFQWQRGHDWVWPHSATPQEIEFFRANPPK